MKTFQFLLLVLGCLPCAIILLALIRERTLCTTGESPSPMCSTLYKDGGVPEVFHSVECRRRTLSSYISGVESPLPTARCEFAMLEGRCKSPDDRNFCVTIPFPVGPTGIMEITIDIAVGSTVTVVLVADGQILVAYVGDSEAILCSETFQSPSEAKATFFRLYRQKRNEDAISSTRDYGSLKMEVSNRFAYYICKELTRHHHPDKENEGNRVESAGGPVFEWGGANGQFSISRSIGDGLFKKRFIDFGSAVDEFTVKHLSGSVGPSSGEQTYDYAAPEAHLNASWYQGPVSKFDMWSVGVIILELILGSPHVFQVDARTYAILGQCIEDHNEDRKKLIYK
ncbi:unnamed protein product [Ilex paraguariensis]|uniref:PPM-type phosphatase domain-containing protein n=1 Tax=Ilex paraguariensis TaxID=185542 RepID=A0ABC8UAP4_9AQUA